MTTRRKLLKLVGGALAAAMLVPTPGHAQERRGAYKGHQRPPQTHHLKPGMSMAAMLNHAQPGDLIIVTGRHYWVDIPEGKDGITITGGEFIVRHGPIRSKSAAHIVSCTFELASNAVWYDGSRAPWPDGSSLMGNFIDIPQTD